MMMRSSSAARPSAPAVHVPTLSPVIGKAVFAIHQDPMTEARPLRAASVRTRSPVPIPQRKPWGANASTPRKNVVPTSPAPPATQERRLSAQHTATLTPATEKQHQINPSPHSSAEPQQHQPHSSRFAYGRQPSPVPQRQTQHNTYRPTATHRQQNPRNNGAPNQASAPSPSPTTNTNTNATAGLDAVLLRLDAVENENKLLRALVLELTAQMSEIKHGIRLAKDVQDTRMADLAARTNYVVGWVDHFNGLVSRAEEDGVSPSSPSHAGGAAAAAGADESSSDYHRQQHDSYLQHSSEGYAPRSHSDSSMAAGGGAALDVARALDMEAEVPSPPMSLHH